MNKIVIAGIQRSGSTVQYNIVRLILDELGYDVNICGDTYKNNTACNKEVYLYKIHTFDERLADGADYIFLTNRNTKDRWESLMNFKKEFPYINSNITQQKRNLKQWKKCNSSHLIKYSRFAKDKKVLIKWVSDIMDIEIDTDKILKKFNDITLPESGRDSKTLFFHNHITKQP